MKTEGYNIDNIWACFFTGETKDSKFVLCFKNEHQKLQQKCIKKENKQLPWQKARFFMVDIPLKGKAARFYATEYNKLVS